MHTTHTHTYTHTLSCIYIYHSNGTEENVFEKRKVFNELFRFKRNDRGKLMDRNRELVPESWSLVRERVLTTGFHAEGWKILATWVSAEERS